MKNMADLDLEEEKLLAEALFETSTDYYFEQDVQLEAVEDDEQQKSNVPNSKVQFPIRRRRSTLFRKLICFVVFVVSLCGALVGVYFLLKSKTVSLDLKLARGQTLRYKFEQESIYEGLEQVRASFSEDVFIHVVNKTGNLYWLKVKINSVPSSKNQNFSFLVRVHLDKQKTRDFGEERFSVFTLSKISREMDFYVYNFLCQLIPVVKIDLFEILLTQITTRKHEVTVQDSVLFPGIATMQQNIRTSDNQIFVTSKINPEGFGAVGSSKTRPELPRIEMTFEEDASISKSSGMLKTSNLELSAKIAFGEDDEFNPGISMKFKSSLRFVEEIASKLDTESMNSDQENFVRLPQPSAPKDAARLRYFFPSEKNYNKNSNVVDKVKELLSLTSNSDSAPRNKDMIEFSKSFHESVEPGQEVNFAAVEQSPKRAGKLEQSVINEKDQEWTKKHEISNGNSDSIPSRDDYDDMDRDGNDDAAEDKYDDDGDSDDDDDDQRWNNRSGLAVPFYPEDSKSKEYESLDERYQGPEDYEDEDDAPRERDSEDDDVEVPERMRNGDNMIDRSKSKAESEKISRKISRKNDVPVGHRNASVVSINKDSKNDDKTMLKTNNRFEHDLNINKTKEKEKKPTRKETSKAPSEVHRTKTSKVVSSPTTNSPKTSSPKTSSPSHEPNVFTDIFDRLWNNLDDEDDDDNNNNNDNEFKLFPPPIPFSISSHFPFLHLRWPSLDDRKKRSLERKPQLRKPRDVGHRDKRRLFSGRAGELKQYTGDDLESVWDVISYAKTNARPKKTTNVFKQRVMGLEIKGDLEHEVQVITMKDKRTEWVIRLSLLINVGEHRFKVLSKTYTMKEIEERFIKHSKPKFENGTVHAGTLVLCNPLFYIENICIEIQLGFVIRVSHSIEYISKEFPVELSIFFKHSTKVDALVSSHMSTLLGSSGVFGHGTLFGAKIPLEVKFSEEKSSGKWCSVANLKSKIGHFYEKRNEMRQWSCTATKSKSNCTGLNENYPHKITKLWYIDGGSEKLHFLNNC